MAEIRKNDKISMTLNSDMTSKSNSSSKTIIKKIDAEFLMTFHSGVTHYVQVVNPNTFCSCLNSGLFQRYESLNQSKKSSPIVLQNNFECVLEKYFFSIRRKDSDSRKLILRHSDQSHSYNG